MTLEGVEISHPDKILFPEKKLTKKDMVVYYHRIADRMLPYLKDRPLTLQRFPDGIETDGFYQKSAGDYFSEFIERVTIKTKEGENDQVICNSKKALIYLANQGVITFHVWLSRKDMLEKPDKVIYDLDPPANSFAKVQDAARKVGDFLKDQNLQPQLMTTGKSGFHVFYKRRRTQDFDAVRKEARERAEKLVEKYPELFTIETLKKNREGKIFLDYLRNAYAQTAVCPYSLRPIPSAGIATLIEWSELSKIKSPDQYGPGNIFNRLSQKDNF